MGAAQELERDGLERELKLLVPDPAAFVALAAVLGCEPDPAVLQQNHFFDTPAHDLRRARCALRLRVEPGRATLTAKGAALPSGAAALAVRPELELALAPDEAAALLAGERSPLAFLARHGGPLAQRVVALTGGAPLVPVGAFANRRARLGPVRLPDPGGGSGPGPGAAVVLELDATEFPGGRVDHEVELELPGPCPETLAALRRAFDLAGLPWRPATSKARRFFEALEQAAAGRQGSAPGGPADVTHP